MLTGSISPLSVLHSALKGSSSITYSSICFQLQQGDGHWFTIIYMSVPSCSNVKSVHPLLWQACNDAAPMSTLSGDGGTLYTSISMALSLPLFLTHPHTLTSSHTPHPQLWDPTGRYPVRGGEGHCSGAEAPCPPLPPARQHSCHNAILLQCHHLSSGYTHNRADSQ